MRKAVVKKEAIQLSPVSDTFYGKQDYLMKPVSELPPEDDGQVLYWNPKIGRYGVTYAKILRAQLMQMQDTEFVRDKVPEMPDYLSYFATLWRYLEKM
jgi:hypothetical protein